MNGWALPLVCGRYDRVRLCRRAQRTARSGRSDTRARWRPAPPRRRSRRHRRWRGPGQGRGGDAGVTGVRRLCPTEPAMAATLGDASELPVLPVDERTRVTDLIAADGRSSRTIDVGQRLQPTAAQDGADGRGRVAEEQSEMIPAPSAGQSHGHDSLDLVRQRAAGRATGSGTPVDLARCSLEPIPSHPVVAGRLVDPLDFGEVATVQPSPSTRSVRSCRPNS
jgi:hypothetical protein